MLLYVVVDEVVVVELPRQRDVVRAFRGRAEDELTCFQILE